MRLLNLFEINAERRLDEQGQSFVSIEEVRALENVINRVYSKLGIDVQLTSTHFFQRLNDPRNAVPITLKEIATLFGKVYNKYNQELRQQPEFVEAVLRDQTTKLNIPFVMEWNRRSGEMELRVKTIIRKDNFMTPNKVFTVEDLQSDAETDRLATEFFHAMSRKLYDNPEFCRRLPELEYKSGDDVLKGFLLDPVEHLGLPQYGDMYVFFLLQKMRSITGRLAARSDAVGDERRFYLMLDCLTNTDDPTQLATRISSTTLFLTVKHEFTHYLDIHRNKNPDAIPSTPEMNSDNNARLYYNSPLEYNAYFHNVADSLLGFIREAQSNPNSDDLAALADIYGIRPQFADTVANLMKTHDITTRGFLKFMTDETRKRALKRIYKLWEYAWQLIAASQTTQTVENVPVKMERRRTRYLDRADQTD